LVRRRTINDDRPASVPRGTRYFRAKNVRPAKRVSERAVSVGRAGRVHPSRGADYEFRIGPRLLADTGMGVPGALPMSWSHFVRRRATHPELAVRSAPHSGACLAQEGDLADATRTDHTHLTFTRRVLAPKPVAFQRGGAPGQRNWPSGSDRSEVPRVPQSHASTAHSAITKSRARIVTASATSMVVTIGWYPGHQTPSTKTTVGERTKAMRAAALFDDLAPQHRATQPPVRGASRLPIGNRY
jgi:hypothetical protein